MSKVTAKKTRWVYLVRLITRRMYFVRPTAIVGAMVAIDNNRYCSAAELDRRGRIICVCVCVFIDSTGFSFYKFLIYI